MSKDTVTQSETISEADVKVRQNSKGQVGKATASLAVKKRWHAWIAENKTAAHKKSYLTLKQWARLQLKAGDKTVEDWFANKSGLFNQERSVANQKAAADAGFATHQTRRKAKKD